MVQTNEKLTELVQLLEDGRELLLYELAGVSDTQLNMRPKREAWSMLQVLHHLHLVEQSVAAVLAVGLQQGAKTEVPTQPVHTIVDRTGKRDCPHYVYPTETIMSSEQITTLLQHSRHIVFQILQSSTEQNLRERTAEHPIFGELSLYQWLEFLYFHEQRHTIQIREAKQALSGI